MSEMNNQIQKQIKKKIDEKKSFLVEAGAGAGKTKNLIDTIDYLLENESGSDLLRYNKHITVITFTNSAVAEINSRIGESDVLQVSTIHNWMWNLISNFQGEIATRAMNIMKTFCSDKEKIDLCEREKNFFVNKEKVREFYDHYSDKKDDFLKYYDGLHIAEYKISNVEKKKKSIQNYIKISQYEKRIADMKNDVRDACKYVYDPLSNHDRLGHGTFSHDTLLKIGSEILKENKTIQKILVDQSPYFFIDEYQDTSRMVINALQKVCENYPRRFLLGLFGDTMQKVYDDSKDDKDDKARGLAEVDPLFSQKIYAQNNYRSYQKIVEVGNNVRGKEPQEPVSKEKGKTDAYVTDCSPDSFLTYFLKMRPELSETGLDVLVMKNQFIADKLGFHSFYSRLNIYSYNRNDLSGISSTDFMSEDEKRYHPVLLTLKKVGLFLLRVTNDIPGLLTDIFPMDANWYKSNSVAVISTLRKKVIQRYMESKPATIRQGLAFIEDLIPFLSLTLKLKLDSIYKKLFSITTSGEELFFKKGAFYLWVQDQMKLSDKEVESFLDPWLNCNLEELFCWTKFVSGINDPTQKIQFHTIQGSKGREYENVLLLLSDSYRNAKSYIRDYLYEKDINSIAHKKKQYLLYVGVTRAKKDLTVVYCDASLSPDLSDKMEHIFGIPAKSLSKSELSER